MYWLIDLDNVKSVYSSETIYLEEQASNTGDDCHKNIKGIPSKKTDKFFDKFFEKTGKHICREDEDIVIGKTNYTL
ncbi:MAG TPA: hypothetical protein VFW07_10785 [Parafilimonas sp.]|nr:hypothetical protein [Parafilimonas sp.]